MNEFIGLYLPILVPQFGHECRISWRSSTINGKNMHGINAKGTPKRNRAVLDKTVFLTLRSLLIFVVFVWIYAWQYGQSKLNGFRPYTEKIRAENDPEGSHGKITNWVLSNQTLSAKIKINKFYWTMIFVLLLFGSRVSA